MLQGAQELALYDKKLWEPNVKEGKRSWDTALRVSQNLAGSFPFLCFFVVLVFSTMTI